MRPLRPTTSRRNDIQTKIVKTVGPGTYLCLHLELLAGEMGREQLRRDVPRSLAPDPVEGFFQPQILTTTARLGHDVADRALLLEPKNVALEQHFLAVVIRVVVPHLVSLPVLVPTRKVA